MESAINIPIQMRSVTDTTGKITPIKFKFKTNENIIKEVNILNTVNYKEINYAGIKAILFTCKASLDNKENMFELKYMLLTHVWVLYRILY